MEASEEVEIVKKMKKLISSTFWAQAWDGVMGNQCKSIKINEMKRV